MAIAVCTTLRKPSLNLLGPNLSLSPSLNSSNLNINQNLSSQILYNLIHFSPLGIK